MIYEDKENSINDYLAQLNEIIESKKKENKSLKTIVDAMRKNQDEDKKSSDRASEKQDTKNN